MQWVLLSGAPRSGTTLLRKLVSAHPNAGVLHEHGLLRLFDVLEELVVQSEPGSPRTTTELQEGLRQLEAAMDVRSPGLDEEPSLPSGRRLESVARSVLGAAFPGKRLEVGGDKLPLVPSWGDEEALLRRAPNLKFVFILRNPLDVVSSSMGRRELTVHGLDAWPVDSVEAACAQYAWAWRRMRTIARAHPDRVLLLKYDELCRSTGREMARVYGFLGLSAFPVPEVRARAPGVRPFLSPEDVRQVEVTFADLIEAWDETDPETLLGAPLFGACTLGERLELSGAAALLSLREGFSDPEGFGCWTDGLRARLALRHAPTDQPGLLELYFSYAYRTPGEPFDLMVSVNESPPELRSIETAPRRLAFSLPAGGLRQGRTEIELFPLRPKRPEEAPAADPRALGVVLSAVRVTPYALPGASPMPPGSAPD